MKEMIVDMLGKDVWVNDDESWGLYINDLLKDL